MKITTFKNEVVILRHGREVLVEVDHAAVEGRMYVAVARDGLRTDYPIGYRNGSVGWDNPEWFSATFKDKVRKELTP